MTLVLNRYEVSDKARHIIEILTLYSTWSLALPDIFEYYQGGFRLYRWMIPREPELLYERDGEEMLSFCEVCGTSWELCQEIKEPDEKKKTKKTKEKKTPKKTQNQEKTVLEKTQKEKKPSIKRKRSNKDNDKLKEEDNKDIKQENKEDSDKNTKEQTKEKIKKKSKEKNKEEDKEEKQKESPNTIKLKRENEVFIFRKLSHLKRLSFLNHAIARTTELLGNLSSPITEQQKEDCKGLSRTFCIDIEFYLLQDIKWLNEPYIQVRYGAPLSSHLVRVFKYKNEWYECRSKLGEEKRQKTRNTVKTEEKNEAHTQAHAEAYAEAHTQAHAEAHTQAQTQAHTQAHAEAYHNAEKEQTLPALEEFNAFGSEPPSLVTTKKKPKRADWKIEKKSIIRSPRTAWLYFVGYCKKKYNLEHNVTKSTYDAIKQDFKQQQEEKDLHHQVVIVPQADSTLGTICQQLSPIWALLTKEQREPFETHSLIDRARYERERNKLTCYDQERLRICKKQRRALRKRGPKPNLNAYQLFVKDRRATVSKEYPDMDFASLGKEMGKRWKLLSEGEKKVFTEKAQMDQDRYKKEAYAYKLQKQWIYGKKFHHFPAVSSTLNLKLE
jgi:HMG (high mobility group) box